MMFLKTMSFFVLINSKQFRVWTKKLCHLFCLISLYTNMLEGWDIFHMKGGILRFIWSTKTFLYDIRELRYKQNNMGYKKPRDWNDKQSNFLESDTAMIYTLFLYLRPLLEVRTYPILKVTFLAWFKFNPIFVKYKGPI